LIGHLVATALGANKQLALASAVVGNTIVDKKYGKFVDLIEVKSIEGQRYQVYVPLDYFSLNEKVDFIAEKTTINAIKRIEDDVE
jgi:outer membrane lipoprotein SlyB